MTPGKLGSFPAVGVQNSAAEAVANNTQTALTFDANTYDNSGMHSTTTNTSRLTAPIAGIYNITAEVLWSTNGNGLRLLSIRRNGDNSLSTGSLAFEEVMPFSGAPTPESVSTQFKLNAGDYVEATGSRSSGSSISALNFNQSSPVFAMTWVGPA